MEGSTLCCVMKAVAGLQGEVGCGPRLWQCKEASPDALDIVRGGARQAG